MSPRSRRSPSVSLLESQGRRMFAATLCFIRETVYQRSRFVASIKQGLAQEIFLCYVGVAKVGAGVRVDLSGAPRKEAENGRSVEKFSQHGRIGPRHPPQARGAGIVSEGRGG